MSQIGSGRLFLNYKFLAKKNSLAFSHPKHYIVDKFILQKYPCTYILALQSWSTKQGRNANLHLLDFIIEVFFMRDFSLYSLFLWQTSTVTSNQKPNGKPSEKKISFMLLIKKATNRFTLSIRLLQQFQEKSISDIFFLTHKLR